jgi:hypothetical protein
MWLVGRSFANLNMQTGFCSAAALWLQPFAYRHKDSHLHQSVDAPGGGGRSVGCDAGGGRLSRCDVADRRQGWVSAA